MDSFAVAANAIARHGLRSILLAWLTWLASLTLLLAAPVNAAERLAEDQRCIACHDEMEAKPILSIYQTRHGVAGDQRSPACRDCHGSSTAHSSQLPRGIRRPATDIRYSRSGSLPGSTADEQSAPCLHCHTRNVARHWPGSRHDMQGLACTSCHTLHTPRDPLLERTTEADTCLRCHADIRAQLHRPSAHPLRDGQLSCSSCHSAHGSDGERSLHQASINDNCHSCHADKRGPFLWEHAPVSDNCLNCHTPHGSPHGALLKARQPWLCQQCHSSNRHPATAYSGLQLPGGSVAPAAQLPLHGCANCHSRVHGSNHPAGARLLR